MTIDEGEATGAIVVTGREIDDGEGGPLFGIVAGHIHGKPSVVDAVFAFIEEDPSTGRFLDLGELLELGVAAGERSASFAQIAIHGDRTDPFIPRLALGAAAVSGALVNPRRSGVFAELGVHEHDAVGVVRGVGRVVQPTHAPGDVGLCQGGPAVEVAWEDISVVSAVELVGQGHLLAIAHALNALSLGFCFGQ